MRICTPRSGSLCVAALSVLAATSYEAAHADEKESFGRSIVSIEASGRAIGAGVIVDKSLIVTSFSLLTSNDRIKIVLDDGESVDVAGYVAARRGKDLVILSLAKPRSNLLPRPLVRDLPEARSLVLLFGGRRDPTPQQIAGQLVAIRSGDALAGRRAPERGNAVDPDGCWLLADTALDATATGGAMLTTDGRLLGVLVHGPDRSGLVRSAVHASHVAELLERREDRPRPVSQLKSHVDPVADSAPAAPVDSLVTPGPVERSGSIEAWITSLVRRLSAARAETSWVERREENIRGIVNSQVLSELEVRKELSSLGDKAVAIRQERPVTRVDKTRYTESSGKFTQPGGKFTHTKEKTVARLEYEYSDRQKEQLAKIEQEAAPLRARIAVLESELRTNRNRLDVIALDQVAGRARAEAMQREVLLAADLLELRPEEDARRMLDRLSELAGAGAGSSVAAAKALLYLRLRDFAKCDEALIGAEKEGASDAILQGVRARSLWLQGDEKAATLLVARTARRASNDAVFALLQCRMAIDRGDFSAALRFVRQSADWGADPVETDLATSLLHGTVELKGVADPLKARSYAIRACEATNWKDWRCLVALAAAGALDKDHALATQSLDRAAAIAPTGCEHLFASWRTSISNSERIRFPWN